MQLLVVIELALLVLLVAGAGLSRIEREHSGQRRQLMKHDDTD